jgi:signal peptidase I
MPKSKEKQSKHKPLTTWPIYILLVLFFVLYIYYQSSLVFSIVFGFAAFAFLLALIIIEFVNSVRESGTKRGITEIIIAIIVVAVIWIALRAFLGTAQPLDVVPSCSMLPVLQRGDLIALSGISKVSQINAPVVDVSSAEVNKTFANIQNESLECISYNATTGAISQFSKPGNRIGLESQKDTLVGNQSQSSNLVKYYCGLQNVKMQNGTIEQEAYTKYIVVGQTKVVENLNNTVVVYQTLPTDLFYKEGDAFIVHRAYAVINASGNYYVLTKGDNNPGLDIQYMNYPAGLGSLSGKVIGSVPYLGYLKLAFSNQVATPVGCNTTVVH